MGTVLHGNSSTWEQFYRKQFCVAIIHVHVCNGFRAVVRAVMGAAVRAVVHAVIGCCSWVLLLGAGIGCWYWVL